MVEPRAGSAESLFSPQWYRVASLRPTLAKQVRIAHHRSRETNWIVLSMPDRRGQIRLNASAWALVGRCDGRQTLNEIWQWLAGKYPDELPSQNTLMPVLIELVRHGYLSCETWPDLSQRQQQWTEDEKKSRRQHRNPLAFRMRLGDPSGLIESLHPILRGLFGTRGLWLCLALTGLALSLAIIQRDQLVSAIATAAGKPGFWLMLWCVYPFIKIIHEFGHGVALRHFGGSTRDAGIALLMLTPAPFVDASEASLLPSGRQRAAVSAAGIVTELALAAIAMLAWSLLADGLAREMMLAVMLIGTVMTVLLNGNPLIRFDGYYVLTDLLELPNLAERSSQRWHRGWIRMLTGIALPQADCDKRERRWQRAYAPLAWAYRIIIMSGFAFWIGAYFRPGGYAIIAMMLVMSFIVPCVRLAHSIVKVSNTASRSKQLCFRSGLAALALLALVLIPLPDRSLVQAVVWVPEAARIRALQPGYIVNARSGNQTMGKAGAPLVTMTDPLLDAEIKVQQGIVDAVRSQWITSMVAPAAAQATDQQSLQYAKRKLEHLTGKRRQLEIALASPESAQRFRLVEPDSDLRGRFVRAGDLLGIVKPAGPLRLRAVLNENDAMRLAPRLHDDAMREAVEIRAGVGFKYTTPAEITGFTPGSLANLPSEAFAVRAGGSVALASPDDESLRPARPVFQLDLAVAEHLSNELTPGQRIWVRLDFGRTSAIVQVVRAIGLLLNTRMAPTLT